MCRLFGERTCFLFEQRNITYCRTRLHVFLLDKETCVLFSQNTQTCDRRAAYEYGFAAILELCITACDNIVLEVKLKLTSFLNE